MSMQFLRQKEGPFLLTLLLAISGWLVTHTVDRLLARPIVEYKLTEKKCFNGTIVSCRIENLSADRCFRDLKFTLAGPKGAGPFFADCQFYVFPPGEAANEPAPAQGETARQLSIVMPEFHPRWHFEFRARKIGDFPCSLLISTEPDGTGKLAETIGAVELTEAGLSTFLIRHEREILCILLTASLIVVVIYLRWLNKVAAGGRPNSTRE